MYSAGFHGRALIAETNTLHTDTAWELWGLHDPYYGVLTDPKFRSNAINAAAKEEFFALGRCHVDQVLRICRRHFDPEFAPQQVLDFGCGVGRLVVPFAREAREVMGMDISPSMLAEAQRNCSERGASNVSLVMSDDALSTAPGQFDLVHSCIVLQHIDVPRGRALFSALVDKVRPGGCGALHVTFAWDAHRATFGVPPALVPPPVLPRPRLRSHAGKIARAVGLRRSLPTPVVVEVANPDPEMQMNFYNLSELSFLLKQAGINETFTEITDHGGAFGAFIFFQRREGSVQSG